MTKSEPEFKSLLPLLERAQYGIEFRSSLCTEAQRWFEDIINSKGLRRIGLLFEILERLSHERAYRTLSTALLGSGKSVESMEKLGYVIRHIHKHHAGNICVESVANLLGMSNSSFSYYFAKSTGSSFTHFLNNVRITHACELLSNTDRPVTEICFAAGFHNVANFNRRFREFKGQTPTEYRKWIHVGHHPHPSGVEAG